MKSGKRLCLYLLVAAAAWGCGARTTRVAAPDRTVAAEELVRQGCYDCLVDARVIYESLSARSAPALARLFEIDLLLALREKELSIDATATLARASQLVRQLRDLPAERLLNLVSAIPPDAGGRRLLPPDAATKVELEAAVALISSSGFSPVFKSYVTLSVQCGRLTADPTAPQADEAPLLAYRRAICSNPVRVEPLKAVGTAVPRFVDASFFLGRAAMASLFRTDGTQVRQLFEEAYARFSNSLAIAFELGTVYQATNDCRRAETLFTRALELSAAHEEARLGRAICRTYLSKNEEAIADATMLIGTSKSATARGDAYYWRAWNRRRLKQIEQARADIDQARALRYNARILALAGMVEYDQRDFDKARTDLESARDLDPRECEARWYLGLVEVSVESWPPGARAFVAAADCYAGLVKESERLRAEMAARTDVTEEFRARQLAGFDAAIAEDSTQRSAAELNAAINYGRAGDLPNATVYMKRAAVDPARRTAVEDLRQVLGVPRW